MPVMENGLYSLRIEIDATALALNKVIVSELSCGCWSPLKRNDSNGHQLPRARLNSGPLAFRRYMPDGFIAGFIMVILSTRPMCMAQPRMLPVLISVLA